MNSFNIVFRKMNTDDLQLLHQWFHIPHVLKWYARGDNYTFKMIKEKYLPRINDESIPGFIICDHVKPVGYIQFYYLTYHLPEGIKDYKHQVFNDFKPDEIVGIDLFIADQNYLYTGFGSVALEQFIHSYIKNKFKAILVDPVKQNSHAILFFERNGFVHMVSDDENHDLLLLKLG